MSPSAAVGTEAPKQQLTQDNQTQCLPKTDGLGREYLWHQRVPEAHHHKADDPYGNNREKNHLKSSQCPITSHFSSLLPKFAVDGLQSPSEMQHCVPFPRQQRIQANTHVLT